MIGLLQRVRTAHVDIDGQRVAQIGPGLLVLLGMRPQDDEARGARLIERLLGYRVFVDDRGRMNRSLRDTDGGLLLVPQFTLAADTRGGSRPGFSTAAPALIAQRLFEAAVAHARTLHPDVACGRFGADMQVGLVNDGPVTFWLES